MKRFVIFCLILCSGQVAAQQVAPQPQQSMQDQLAVTYFNINTALAKQVDAANAQIAKLTDDLAKAQSRIKELESKQEEKK